MDCRNRWRRLAAVSGLAAGLSASIALGQAKEPPTPPTPPTPPIQPVPAAGTQPDGRKIVKTQDDLPRHTYTVAGKASEFILTDAPFKALVAKVKADAEADLAGFRIEDPTTLQGYHALLQQIALFENRPDEALRHAEKVRELEAKESKRLMTGQMVGAMLAAEKSTGERAGGPSFDAAFKKDLDARIRALPWEVVREDIMAARGRAEIINRELVLGGMQGSVDKIVEQQKGEVSQDIARGLVATRVLLDRLLPLQPLVVPVYTAIIDAKETRAVGKDIWTPSQVALTEADRGTPVVIGIWDSGVDTRLYPRQLWVNTGEVAGNGKDDDGNGFVDDDSGIAYDLDSNRIAGPLADLSELKTPREEISRFDKAFSDLNNNIRSPEAEALKKHIGGLKADQVTPFIEDMGLYGGYCHGTHVAGIAAEGNPYARLLYARITFDHHAIPVQTPSIEQARKDAQATKDTIDYFRKAGVRVVNMSFGGSRQGIEDALEAKGVGKSSEERAALAREMFKIGRDAMDGAMRGAPEILFIAAAGNEDNDNEFSETLPSCLSLPNMVTVGAIDQTGKPTGFTTFGKNVKLYANGFEVESSVPGGEKRKYSGTSMAAPNAANLAGKLLAVNPKLTTAQLIEMMTRGADPMEGQEGRLILNPKKTVEMARTRG